MIKNIIFDMGNVLIAWSPKKIVARLGLEEADSALLEREVFLEYEWVSMDHGIMSQEEGYASIYSRLPERLHECVPPLVFWWKDPLWPVPGMKALVEELKAAVKEA